MVPLPADDGRPSPHPPALFFPGIKQASSYVSFITMSTNKPFEFFIQWHLTEACNLRCKHCYQGERSTEELPLTEIQKTVAEISDMIDDWSEAYGAAFSRSMNITGGEPFLRRDLFEILREVKEKEFEIYLLTNGTLVDRARARKLAELGVNGVQVSLEGPEEVHDAIRGKGSYDAAIAGVERLVDAGLDVTLNVTLSDLNADEVRKVVSFGSHAGVRQVGFSRLVPDGKGRALLSRMLSPERLRELYGSLFSLELASLAIVTGDPVAAQMRITAKGDAGDTAISGCSAGVAGLTILPNGNVTPCRRLPLSLGNVRKDSLRELWATSPILEALRDRSRYKGRCGACERWARCRGCRAIAYAWSRSRGEDDFLAEDPQCFLET
jgi:radical SAM protein with 4Fe4S-binding SPASM domain